MAKLAKDISGFSRESMTSLTIVADNNVLTGSSLILEHGFFVAFIEKGSERILFDTGQGPALGRSAATPYKDLAVLPMNPFTDYVMSAPLRALSPVTN